MNFSQFGQKFTSHSGILQLMDDLGSALAAGDADMILLGGGNPAAIPGVQMALRQRMHEMLADEESFERMVGNYAPPQGDKVFTTGLARLLRQTYGWDLGPENIALTNGSQTAFFYLFNLLGGAFGDGWRRRILLPIAPEYIGYSDVGLGEGLFIAHKPEFDFVDDLLFKYRVDCGSLRVGDDIGAICVSRPTNPTGNVLTDDEVAHLSRLARGRDIPLIIDNAYGAPFPSIIFSEVQPIWDEHIILCLSLSKLGMPGLRTGIVVAREEIIRAVTALNAVLSLAPGNGGASLASAWVQSGEIIRLSRETIRPFYQSKAEQVLGWVREAMAGLPCRVHRPEGAFFLWLWFPNLPITSAELYRRLKRRQVIVVPGHYFFPGLEEDWRHRFECLRLNYAGDAAAVRRGIGVIAEEVRQAFDDGS
jgi:valine--pyruvate aminotransferase